MLIYELWMLRLGVEIALLTPIKTHMNYIFKDNFIQLTVQCCVASITVYSLTK
jgi:hypothetical protein